MPSKLFFFYLKLHWLIEITLYKRYSSENMAFEGYGYKKIPGEEHYIELTKESGEQPEDR